MVLLYPATYKTRNQRQRARGRNRSASVSEGTDIVECTIITIILRRPSQQYGAGSTTARSSGSPPPYDDTNMTFPWETEMQANGSRPQNETDATSRRGASVTSAINIRGV
ncbi:hypothetical protein PWT90_00277 [Aphanocladium album]|nr:hypothetical protein PWT90_00277 [Aphanocladium album]